MNVKRTLAALLTLTAVAACDVEDYPLCVLAPVYEGQAANGDRIFVDVDALGTLNVEVQTVEGEELTGALPAAAWDCGDMWVVSLQAGGGNPNDFVAGEFSGGTASGVYEREGWQGAWSSTGIE